MARTTKKSKKVTSKKPLPAKKAGSGVSSFVKVKRTKRNTRVVITLTLPRLPLRKKPATKTGKVKKNKRANRTKRSLSRAFTMTLLAISVLGFISVAQALYTPHPVKSGVSPPALQAAPSQPTGLPRAVPVQLEIPSIAVEASLNKIGKNNDGSMEVPRDPDVAGWYEYAPTPGEIGPAVIAGHVDSLKGPAVFWNLNKLQPGDLIKIQREDNRTVTFKVDKQELLDQNNFPTEAVYGNIDHAGLRLITCGGDFNLLTRHYSHNVVVYASMVNEG